MAPISSAALERHRKHRAERVPTVSVLLGDADVWEWAWARWQRENDTPVVVAEAAPRDAALGVWFGAEATVAAFRSAVLQTAATHTRVTVTELQARLAGHSSSQRETFIEQLDRATGLGHAPISAALSPLPSSLAGWISAEFPRGLRSAAHLLGSQLPGLFLRGSARAARHWLGQACATLITLAEVVPEAELALVSTESEFSSWQARARPRDAALLGAGVLRLERRSSETPATGQHSHVVYDEQEFARSRAERLLHQCLQQRPRTRELFKLNQVLPARFGSAQLEVDLLCESLRIAVEIDGYHHFRDQVAYRRDRSKDVLLQRLGYKVVRVLAADVTGELDFVIGTIDQIVAHEQKGSAK